MFKPNVKKLSVSSTVIFLSLFAMTGCSDKDDKKSVESKAEVVQTEVVQAEEVKTQDVKAQEVKGALKEIIVSDNIMTMLAGTDPCFEAVEIVRDDQDLQSYRDFGDKIILKDDYVERPGHKTYVGTIAAMLKEDRNIKEIRQVLLNKCRAFGVANEKAKEEAKAREALKKQSTEEKDDENKDVEKKESN